ncbi:MAG: hypothetical protein KJ648_07340 [Candidatus Omnitrophica bacterium]|nr:hypothetical protein [Candidatus Omnitrophota bacterium]
MKRKKMTKVRRSFRDIEEDEDDLDAVEPPEPEDDKKRFPGAGPEARHTTKICTAVLNGREVAIPGGLNAKQAWKWCADNMKGRPYIARLSALDKETCTKPNGKPMARTACRKAILAGEGRTAVGLRLKLDSVVSKGPTLVTRTVKGRELMPQTVGNAKKPCRPSSSGEIRDCHYELEFFTKDQAAAKKLADGAGPYIRVCGGKAGQDGKLYRVNSPEEAKLITDNHCCTKKGGKDCTPLPQPAGFGRSRNRFGLYGYRKGGKR